MRNSTKNRVSPYSISVKECIKKQKKLHNQLIMKLFCGSWGTRTFQLQLCISISFTLVKTSFCSIFVAKLPNL